MVFTRFMKRYLWKERVFILSCVFVIYSAIVVKEYAAEEFDSRKNVKLFYDFKTLIDTVYSDENVRKYATHLIFIKYERECIKGQIPLPGNKTRKPFIEVECNNETVRGVLLRMLAFRTGVSVLEDPAECLEEFQDYYNASHPLHGAFSTLSMYANAYQTSQQWYDNPVAVTGYWLDKAASFINKAYESKSIPMFRSPVYDFPPDLLMPDIAFSVQFENMPNVSQSYQKRYQEIMSKINGPVLFQVSPNLPHEEMVTAMIRETKKHLGKELDVTDFVEKRKTDNPLGEY